MTAPPAARPVVDAVVAALGDAGLEVGDGEAPPAGGWDTDTRDPSRFAPYAVVHSITGDLDGPLGDPWADAGHGVQVTAVGATREQSQWVADRARATLLDGTLTATGRGLEVHPDGMAGTRPDDTVRPAVWITTDRYTVHDTPTT